MSCCDPCCRPIPCKPCCDPCCSCCGKSPFYCPPRPTDNKCLRRSCPIKKCRRAPLCLDPCELPTCALRTICDESPCCCDCSDPCPPSTTPCCKTICATPTPHEVEKYYSRNHCKPPLHPCKGKCCCPEDCCCSHKGLSDCRNGCDACAFVDCRPPKRCCPPPNCCPAPPCCPPPNCCPAPPCCPPLNCCPAPPCCHPPNCCPAPPCCPPPNCCPAPPCCPPPNCCPAPSRCPTPKSCTPPSACCAPYRPPRPRSVCYPPIMCGEDPPPERICYFPRCSPPQPKMCTCGSPNPCDCDLGRRKRLALHQNAPCCRRCGQKVFAAEKIMASSGAFHTCCFSCYCCHKPLEVTNVYEFQGEIYCKCCYNKFFGVQGYGYGCTLQSYI